MSTTLHNLHPVPVEAICDGQCFHPVMINESGHLFVDLAATTLPISVVVDGEHDQVFIRYEIQGMDHVDRYPMGELVYIEEG